MDLRRLHYFVTVVDCGSVSRAAGRLHVAQPVLSQHVRRMEGELRTTLLDRSARGVTPTDAGRRLYQHARSLLEQAAQLPELVRDAAANPIGEVRIGMPATASELIVPPLIEAARKRYPGVRLRPVEAMSGYILDWLRRGEVDLALIYGVTSCSGLVMQPLLEEGMCLIGRKGATVGRKQPGAAAPLSAALRLPLITPGRPHGLRDLIDRAAHSLGSQLTRALEIDSYSQIKQLVMRGAGFAMLPETAIRHEIESGLLEAWRINRPTLRRQVYLAYVKDRPLSSAARAIAGLSWEIIRELVSSGAWIAKLQAGGHGPAESVRDER